MPASLGEAVLDLSADTKQLRQDLSQAEKTSRGIFKRIGSSAKQMLKVAGGRLLSQGINKAVQGFKNLARTAVDSVGQAQQLEMSLEAIIRENQMFQKTTDGSRKQVMSFGEATDVAASKTQDMLDFLDQMSIKSAYGTSDVRRVAKYAQITGMATDQTKEFTEAFLDFGAVHGITSENLTFAGEQFLQLRQTGKILERDLRQLRRVGIDVGKIMETEMGMSVDEFNKKVEESPELMDQFFESFVSYSEKTSKGMSEKLGGTISGIIDRWQDSMEIGARRLFRPVIEAATPAVSELLDTLETFVTGPRIAKIGEQLGQIVSNIAETLTDLLTGEKTLADIFPERVIQVARTIWNVTKKIASVIGDLVTGEKTLADFIPQPVVKVGRTLLKVLGKIRDVISGLISGNMTLDDILPEKVAATARKIWDALVKMKNTLSSLISGDLTLTDLLPEKVVTTAKRVTQQVKTLLKQAQKVAARVQEWVAPKVQQFFSKVPEYANKSRQSLKKVWQFLKDVAEAVKEVGVGIAEGFLHQLDLSLVENLGGALGDLFTAFRKLGKAVADFLGRVSEGEGVAGFWRKLGRAIGAFLGAGVNTAIRLLTGAARAIETLANVLTALFQGDGIGALKALKQGINDIAKAILGKQLSGGIKQFAQTLKTGFQQAKVSVVAFVTDVKRKWLQFVNNLDSWWVKTNTKLTMAKNKITTWATNVKVKITAFVLDVKRKWAQFVKNAQSWWVKTNTKLTMAKNKIVAWATNLVTKIVAFVLDVKRKWAQFVKNLQSWWTKTNTKLTMAKNKLTAWIEKVVLKITKFALDVKRKLSQWYNNLSQWWSKVKSKLLIARKNLTSWVATFVSKITGFVSDVKAKWDTFYSNLASMWEQVKAKFVVMRQGFVSFVTQLREKIDNFVEIVLGIPGKLRNAIDSFFSAGADLIGGIIEGINSKIEALKNKVAEAVGLANKAGRSEAEADSPSRLTMRLGADMGEGLIQGWTDRIRGAFRHGFVSNELGAMARQIKPQAATSSPGFGGPIQININNPVISNNMDIRDMAIGVVEEIQRMQR